MTIITLLAVIMCIEGVVLHKFEAFLTKQPNHCSIFMKITHFMLTVSAVIFAWLTAAYLRPVPSSSYEHASTPFAYDTMTPSELETPLVTEVPAIEGAIVVK